MEFEFVEHLGKTDLRLFVVTIYKRQTHFHSDVEIFMPLEGSILVDVANRRSTVETGEFFIVNRNEAHSMVHTNTQNMLLVLQFSPNFAREYYPQLLNTFVLQRHVVRAWMPKLHAAMSDAFADMLRCVCDREGRDSYPLELMGSLNQIAAAIMRYGVYERLDDRQGGAEKRDRARVAGIIDYIQGNYTHNLSLSDLARRENLDMTYLSHLIKNRLGISFREYVNRLRLERAAYLVVNTQMRMIDVCVECGYSDYRYLNRAFLKEYGMTPAQVRAAGADASLGPAVMGGEEESFGETEQQYVNLLSVYERAQQRLKETGGERLSVPHLSKITK